MLRLLYILYVFALCLAFGKGSRWDRIGAAFDRLGLVWKKLGQLLAARGIRELEQMYDDTSQVPFEQIRAVVERNIGTTVELFFDTFNERPYASASIAQTHRAALNGEEVMVKVRRPDVPGGMREDLRIFRLLIRLAAMVSTAGRCLRSARIPEQFEEWLTEEIDFRREAENLENFRESYKTDLLAVPEVRFVSSDMLIETFIDGIPCNRWDERYRKEGYDPQESVRAFIPPMFGPPMRGIPVHMQGDPHPANLLFLRKKREGIPAGMGVVDFGRVRLVTKPELKMLNTAMFAVYAGKTDELVKVLLEEMGGGFSFSRERRLRAFKRDIGRYVKACRNESMDFWLIQLSRILLRHGVPVMDSFVYVCNFGVLASKLTHEFLPGHTVIDLVRGEIRAGMLQQVLELSLELCKKLATKDPVVETWVLLKQISEKIS